MIVLRSAVLMAILLLVTVPYGLLGFLIFPFGAMTRYRIISSWATMAMWLIRPIVGIRYRVIGTEHLPPRPSVVLAKHQSAWETIALQRILPPICYVLKKELLRVPFFGWGLAQMPMISIDRAAGKEALDQVVEQGRQRLAEGFWVVVFPEGTRVAPGLKRRYKVGGAWLAAHTGAPVVPIAHNAGEFWARRAFLKRPGEITVSIGPAIDTTGLAADEINRRAEAWIEAEMRRLFPHHYAGRREKKAASGTARPTPGAPGSR
ncbi:MAG: 1-acyl-sn-glycerol-3-phosphate acyltransferase [Betaproteobacteria bacterium]|nr:1-acyl-sn-glycerol-3-phosphate acyltransferase [Betaproteobacteria bacterium]